MQLVDPAADQNQSWSWTPDTDITYTVQATTKDGCIATKKINLVTKINISIPGAFTPNADGRNDLFRAIYGPDISQVDFSIFNRWGQLVFEDRGTHKGWDGYLLGQPQPAGTYAWSFRYTTPTGQQKQLSGTMVLIS